MEYPVLTLWFETQVQRSLIAQVKRDFPNFTNLLPATAPDQPLHDHIRARLFQIHSDCALRCIAPELWHHQASVLEFCIDELGCSHNARFWAAFRALVHHCGWVFLRKEVCLVCDRPTKYAFDAQGNYHAEGEPAIGYSDGFGIYVHHGTTLPEQYGIVPPSQWQARWLTTEPNAQLRRLLIQEIGYERVCQELSDRALSTWREYELLSIQLAHQESLNLLKMTCPSTGHLHFLVVPPNLRSAREAIRWVNWGIDPDEFTVQT